MNESISSSSIEKSHYLIPYILLTIIYSENQQIGPKPNFDDQQRIKARRMLSQHHSLQRQRKSYHHCPPPLPPPNPLDDDARYITRVPSTMQQLPPQPATENFKTVSPAESIQRVTQLQREAEQRLIAFAFKFMTRWIKMRRVGPNSQARS